MNAFVKTTNGNFPNQNFYLAWKGFDSLKYNVIKFEDVDLIDNSFWMSCNRSTPVFAGVAVFDDIMDRLKVDYKKIDTYPESLIPFLERNIQLTTLGKFRNEWNKDEENPIRKFMKPVKQKQFNGSIMNSLLDWIKVVNLSEDTEVYISDPVHFLSEYRIYIKDGEILTGKHYKGNWNISIDIDVVIKAIKEFKEAPRSYALDFGYLSTGETALIEFNDATSLGNYGLDVVRYADMLTIRWFEICQ